MSAETTGPVSPDKRELVDRFIRACQHPKYLNPWSAIRRVWGRLVAPHLAALQARIAELESERNKAKVDLIAVVRDSNDAIEAARDQRDQLARLIDRVYASACEFLPDYPEAITEDLDAAFEAARPFLDPAPAGGGKAP